MQNPAQEHVDSMTMKLGSAVQDLQWQITGAVERLAHQADEFMTCADGQPQAPVTTAQMDELNGISMASSQIASRESSRRLSKQYKQTTVPVSSKEKEMPSCWSTSGQTGF